MSINSTIVIFIKIFVRSTHCYSTTQWCWAAGVLSTHTFRYSIYSCQCESKRITLLAVWKFKCEPRWAVPSEYASFPPKSIKGQSWWLLVELLLLFKVFAFGLGPVRVVSTLAQRKTEWKPFEALHKRSLIQSLVLQSHCVSSLSSSMHFHKLWLYGNSK